MVDHEKSARDIAWPALSVLTVFFSIVPTLSCFAVFLLKSSLFAMLLPGFILSHSDTYRLRLRRHAPALPTCSLNGSTNLSFSEFMHMVAVMLPLSTDPKKFVSWNRLHVEFKPVWYIKLKFCVEAHRQSHQSFSTHPPPSYLPPSLRERLEHLPVFLLPPVYFFGGVHDFDHD